MKKMVYSLAIAMIILISVAMIPATAVSSSNEKIPVIIGFYDKSDAELVKAHGGDIKYQYNNIHAIAASLPEQAINALENNPNVAYIEEDIKVCISKKPVPDPDPVPEPEPEPEIPTQPPQFIPWGVDKVEADAVPITINGSGVNVSIIDTGIDYTHPDLSANYAGGYDFVNDDGDPMDDNGHGTHVAGTIAAVNNAIGVIGVAPNASLYSFKVLDSEGYGWVSDINSAIDMSINTSMDVISMSLGGDYSESQEQMCQKAYEAGIVIVAAAGNQASSVSYPAACNSVIAVSAIDEDDEVAYFSNYGPQIELAAPGVAINSTYLGGGYKELQGTSMATPHVSGVVALMLSENSTLDPVTVRGRLANTATDFGDAGKDNDYGYGLVNATAALESDLTFNPVLLSPEGDYVQPDRNKLLTWATAEFCVTNQPTSEPVLGAVVKGNWTINGLDTMDEVSGTTDSDGIVVFKSETIRSRIDVVFGFVSFYLFDFV